MKSVYITEEQEAFLKSLKGIPESEHIRRAIDEYIEKRKAKASLSPSKKVNI